MSDSASVPAGGPSPPRTDLHAAHGLLPLALPALPLVLRRQCPVACDVSAELGRQAAAAAAAASAAGEGFRQVSRRHRCAHDLALRTEA
jgi:hypothetical protein